MQTYKSIPFLVIEDADPHEDLQGLVKDTNPAWELIEYIITDSNKYSELLQHLASHKTGPAIFAFDLEYTTVARSEGATPHWDTLDDAQRRCIPQGLCFGVNALLHLFRNISAGDFLIVISSQYCSADSDSGRALRDVINAAAREKHPKATVSPYFTGGSLTVDPPALGPRLKDIDKAWEAAFGCLASRIRSSATSGWFRGYSPSPECMIHGSTAEDVFGDEPKTDINLVRGTICPWLASVFGTDVETAGRLVNHALGNDGFLFYKKCLQRVTGACALHCGVANGKPMNLHALAFIACAYAADVESVFCAVPWNAFSTGQLLPSTNETVAAEDLLYALVGRPGNADDRGVFGAIGIHSGQDGGVMGSKTVIAVTLTPRAVTIIFGIRGTELADKVSRGNPSDAATAVLRLRRMLEHYVGSVEFVGGEKTFKLTISTR